MPLNILRVFRAAGVTSESSQFSIFHGGFDTLEKFHSIRNYAKVDDLKHLRLPDVPESDQKKLGYFIHQLEGYKYGITLPGWKSENLAEFVSDYLRPAASIPTRPVLDTRFMGIQSVYGTHDQALTDFYKAWESFVPLGDFEVLEDRHQVACAHDLAALEGDLNRGAVAGVSDSCQHTLGRVLTWCRLNGVWLADFDIKLHKPLICDALLEQELLRKGVVLAAWSE